MRHLFRLPAIIATTLLSGCTSQPHAPEAPQVTLGVRKVDAAFVGEDKHLYLFSKDKTARFDAAPFKAYQALVASPLRSTIACSRMYWRLDMRTDKSLSQVHGSYAMLFKASDVTAAQAQQYGLVLLNVSAPEAAAAKAAADNRLTVQPQHTRYELAANPMCQLPASGGQYYSALFESHGQWVEVPNRDELWAQSRFAKPITTRVEVVRSTPQRMSRDISGSDMASVALGIAALPIALPILVVAMPFLGPDSWK